MQSRVTLIEGPARSGKTARLLAEYRRQLAKAVPSSTLWIAPTHRSAVEIHGRLMDGQLQACFAPGVVTFEAFAQAVLQASGASIRPMSGLLKRQLLRRLIETAQTEGKLKHFTAIADTDGLLDLVSGFISEIKRLEIWPEEFATACEARGMTEKDRDLIGLYFAYQETLTQQKLYDAEGRIWSAREFLQEGQRDPYGNVELVVVDGFTDFTRTQHEILQCLAQRVTQMFISLPSESDSCRAELFGKTSKTRDRLQKYHSNLERVQTDRSASTNWPSMDHVERELFKSPHDQTPFDNVENIEILAASGQLGEVQLVARRVKELILQQSVSPSEIVVVYRSVRDVAPLVREVFTEAGIPFALEASQPLNASPALRALTAMLQLQADDWPYQQTLAVLASNYFQPQWPEWEDFQTPAALERLVRQLQVPKGGKALISQVESLEQWTREVQAEAGESFGRAGSRTEAPVLPVLCKLQTALDALPEQATQHQWADALESLASETGLLKAIDQPGTDSPLTILDQRAWQRLISALRHRGDLSGLLEESSRPLTLTELLNLLNDIMHWETLPQSTDETGRVRVLSVPSARALSIPYLFIAGLSEKAFPPPSREDRVYSEGEYHSLIQQGLPLVDRSQRTREEMLLFYEVFTRATERIYLSYPALNESAQPLSPSSFLLEVQRACGEGNIPRTEKADLSPVPWNEQPLGARDFRVKGVALATQGEANLLAGLIATEPTTANLIAGLRTTDERKRSVDFCRYEGILESDPARRQLAHQFGPDTLWSPSRLEQYAYCPHQFFLERVLKIKPLDDLVLEVDHATRGQILHEVLSEVHREVNQQLGGPGSPASQSQEEFSDQFNRVLDRLIEASSQGSRLEAALREIDRRTITQWADQYYQQHVKYDSCWPNLEQPFQPTHFEVQFGSSRGDAGPTDSLSTAEPFALDLGDQTIKLQGRIDRIDLTTINGQLAFNVIDYKSGVATSLRLSDIEAGTALQLPLYVMAVESLLLNGEAVPWRTAYWFVRDSGFTDKKSLHLTELEGELLTPTEDWIALRQAITQRVGATIEGIRNGAFPMASANEQCTSRCSFKTVCRINQVRSQGKTWPPEEVSS